MGLNIKEWVCKPSSVSRPRVFCRRQKRGRAVAIYLGLPLPTGSSDLPAGRAVSLAAHTRARYGRIFGPVFYTGSASQLLGLAGGGVYPAGDVTAAAVRSYRTISPLPVPQKLEPSAVYFLWHFPWGRPRWPLAITVPFPARTFLPRFCLRQKTRGRPPNPLFPIDYLLFVIDYYLAQTVVIITKLWQN